MEKKEASREVIEIKVSLAKWIIDNYDIAKTFFDHLDSIRRSCNCSQYRNDETIIYPYIQFHKFRDDAERYDLAQDLFAAGKVSSVDNAYFYILYKDKKGSMISRDFDDLFNKDFLFRNAKRFIKYLRRNVGKKNFDRAKEIINKINDLEFNYMDICINCFTEERECYGEVYNFFNCVDGSPKFNTVFDFVDGDIKYSKKKISTGNLCYSSANSSFYIEGIKAFPTNCNEFDLQKHRGDYKKNVEYPYAISVKDLLFDPNSLPGKTVDESLFKMFPQLKNEIVFNRFYKRLKDASEEQKKFDETLEKALEMINDESIDKSRRLEVEKELEKIKLGYIQSLKILQGDPSFLITDKEKPNTLNLVDDGK